MAKGRNAIKFIERLLEDELVQDLENHADQGVKVTTHTYDVLKISYEEIKKGYKNLEIASERIDFFSIIVGVILHDLSKGTLRKIGENLSHSQMIIKKPEYLIKETEIILLKIEAMLELKIIESVRKNIVHIVVSHHGKWGKIQPNTKEARLVHDADMYSAKYHRINPIGADKILQAMNEGLTFDEVAKKFECTTGVLKDRLKRAKFELGLKNTKQLMNYYKNGKKIPIGDIFFTKRVRETEKLIKSVEKIGFRESVLRIPLLEYLEDKKVFEENKDERENRCSIG